MDTHSVEYNYFEELEKRVTKREIASLAKGWWLKYLVEPITYLNAFGLCLINSGGVFEVSINLENIQTSSALRKCFNKDAFISNSPIFNKQFSKKLSIFIDEILIYDFWKLFENIGMMKAFSNLIKILRSSPWTPIRAVAYITGLKIITQCMRCLYYMKNTPNIRNQNKIVVASAISDIIVHGVFVFNCRDRVGHLRRLPLLYLCSWFEENPEFIMNNVYLKYIKRALDDKVYLNKKTVLELINDIFSKEIIINKQKSLFEQLKPSLLEYLMSSNSKCATYALRIINAAMRNFNVLLTSREEIMIFTSLYDRRNTVIEEAKLYIHDMHLRRDLSLLNIIEMYTSCPVKCSKIVVNNFCECLLMKYSWDDWKQELLSGSIDYSDQLLDILYEYISSNFKYDMKSSEENDNVEISTTIQQMKSFSAQFSSSWLDLTSVERFITQPLSLSKLLKLFQHVNFGCLTANNEKECANFVSKIFFESENYIVLKECSNIYKTHEAIKKSSYFINKMKTITSNYVLYVIDLLQNTASLSIEDLHQVRNKVVLLLKSCYFETDSLWQCLDLSMQDIHLPKVEDILILMYHIIMNDRAYYVCCQTNNKEHSKLVLKTHEPPYVVSLRVKGRISVLKRHCLNIFGEFDFEALRYEVSVLFGELVNNFGKHVSQLSILNDICCNMTPDELILYMEYTSGFMVIDCCGRNCVHCSAMKYCLSLIKNGVICISYLKYFFQYFGKVTQHSTILLQSLHDINEIPAIAAPVMNGFIMFYNRELVTETLSLVEEHLKNMMNFFTRYIPFNKSDCRLFGIHLLLYTETLINQGYTVFTGFQEIIKETFSFLLLQEVEKEMAK